MVKSDSPWNTLKDLVDYAKANPGKIKYSTANVGGAYHLSMLDIALREGIKWDLVPFQGGPQAILAVLGGHVQAASQGADFVPRVESGSLRLLAVTGDIRAKHHPDIPCLKELGYEGFSSAMGIIGPPGMPKDIVNVLDGTFREALSQAEVQNALAKLEKSAAYMNSFDFASWVTESLPKYSEFMKRVGLSKR